MRMSDKIRLSSVIEFYVLEALDSESSYRPTKTRHPRIRAKFVKDVKEFKDYLASSLGVAVRDYLVSASIGEAYHASSCCESHFEGSIDRIDLIREYTPESICEALSHLFNGYWWDSAYGGESWGNIINVARMYDTLPDINVFLDYVMDVYHNGGTLFDKHSAGSHAKLKLDISRNELLRFLDFKYECEILYELRLYGRWSRYLSAKTRGLINRFFNIFDADEINMGLGDSKKFVNLYEHPSAPIVPHKFQGLTYGESSWDYTITASPTYTCDDCGDYLEEYSIYQAPGEMTTYCEACFYDYYTYCEDCDEIIYTDDAIQYDHTFYCDYCIKDVAVQCENCFIYFDKDDVTEYDYEHVCLECFNEVVEVCQFCKTPYEIQDTENNTCPHCGYDNTYPILGKGLIYSDSTTRIKISLLHNEDVTQYKLAFYNSEAWENHHDKHWTIWTDGEVTYKKINVKDKQLYECNCDVCTTWKVKIKSRGTTILSLT